MARIGVDCQQDLAEPAFLLGQLKFQPVLRIQMVEIVLGEGGSDEIGTRSVGSPALSSSENRAALHRAIRCKVNYGLCPAGLEVEIFKQSHRSFEITALRQ